MNRNVCITHNLKKNTIYVHVNEHIIYKVFGSNLCEDSTPLHKDSYPHLGRITKDLTRA